MRHWLPRFAVNRPVTVLMGFLGLCVLGLIAFFRVPLQMMPSGFEPPYLWVWVPYQDSSPAETDAQIVRPLEEQLSTLPGIKSLESNANSGSASFSIELYQSVNPDEAYAGVVDRIERAMPELPDDVQYYGIYRFDPSDEPIVYAGVSIDESLEDPYDTVTRVVQKRLERVPGVAKIEVWGVDEKVVFIDFHRDALIAYGVSLVDLMGQLSSDNFQLASGKITEDGEVRYVRSLARYEGVDDIKRMPVGPGVVLSDVATVRYRSEKSASFNHIDGREACGIAISKESSANTVEVSRAVNAAFAELEADPRTTGLKFHTFFSQGELIEDSINNLLGTMAQGGLFAVLVLYLFLRDLRVTLLISACIPLSMLFTVGVLYFTGGSLNLLSLLGLMIAVGMVVDNAIVVVETIYRWRQHEHADPRTAAIEGTSEVNLAILLSTSTTMVVFLPMILMSEDAMFSFFMGSLGFPVIFALGASLVVALLFTPVATVYLREGKLAEEPRWSAWLTRVYVAGLRRVLTHRFDTFIGVMGVLILTAVVPFQSVGCTDQGGSSMSDFTLRFEVPSTFTPRERLDVLTRLEGVIEAHREEWGVRVYRSRLNSSSNTGSIYAYLRDDFEDMSLDEVREAATEALPEIPGVRVWSGWGSDSGREGNVITLELEGEDADTLAQLAEEVLRRARTVPGVLSAENTVEEGGRDELHVNVDRESAARYGLSAQAVGRTLAFAMRGRELSKLQMEGREVTVFARFAAADRADLDTMRDLPMVGLRGPVPMRAVTEVEYARGFSSIKRIDRRTALPLRIELDEDFDMPQAYAALEVALADMEFPRGYGWNKGDRFDDQMANDEARDMALVLSIVFVFLLMAFLFESFILPMAILTTIPLALVGVFWTLYLTDTSIDVMGGVGLVILVGVVVNNGIVLIDLVTQLRAEGFSRTEALLQGAERRMRPILMTALTTIVGLIPMAIGSSTFIGIPYAPLGRVVGGGIAASTVLTLFFVPYMYTLLDDLRAVAGRVLRYAIAPRQSPVETK